MPIPQTLTEILKEFCADVEAAYGQDTDENKKPSPELIGQRLQSDTGWYDLARTYEKAKRLLMKQERMSGEHDDPFKIQSWLRGGENFTDGATDINEVIQRACGCMNSANTWDIVGECVFKGEDDIYYVGVVTFVVSPGNPDYINELVHEVPEDDD